MSIPLTRATKLWPAIELSTGLKGERALEFAF
jgi:hypothetical protein